MKKLLIVLLIICILYIVLCFIAMFQESQMGSDEKYYFYWIPEESYFDGYEIIDANTIRFKYSVCFVNEYDVYDVEVDLSAKFKRSELKGWVKYSKFFDGFINNTTISYAKIKAGEKRNISFTFEGEYLGGEVNQKLSFPVELIVGMSFHDTALS